MTDVDDIDLTDPDRFADGPPHEAYRRLRDTAPLYWHEPTATTPDGEGFWCLTRHEDVAWAARQPDLFSSEGGGDRAGGGTLIEDLPAGFAAGVLLNMQDDPRHRHVRRLLTPSVSPKRLRTIEAALRVRCAEILDASIEGERATSSSTSPPSFRSRPSHRCWASHRRTATSSSTGPTPPSTTTTTTRAGRRPRPRRPARPCPPTPSGCSSRSDGARPTTSCPSWSTTTCPTVPDPPDR